MSQISVVDTETNVGGHRRRVHIVGDGVVGRRLQQLLKQHQPVTHPARRIAMSQVSPADVIVLAHGGDQTPIIAGLVEHGVHVVSMADADDDTYRLLELDTAARQRDLTIVAGAATSPGLSGLIARHGAADFDHIDEIHIALHGTAGPECARVHHRSLKGRAVAWHNDTWRTYVGGSGRELVWFPEPIGALDAYRAQSPEPVLMQRVFAGVDRVSHRRTARRRDRFTAQLPMLRPPHPEGGIGGIRIELRGAAPDGSRMTAIYGVAEMIATATAATAAAFVHELIGPGLPAGLVVPGDASLDTVRLLRHVANAGVRLQEFTGIPQPR